MTWMLATSHANQLAAQQMNQINNNNNTKNNNNNNNYHAKTPSPPPILQTTQAPPMNGLITPPPITTTIYTPTNVSPMQVYGNQFPPMMAQFPPGYLPPPHQMPPHTQALQHPHLPPMMHGQVYNPENMPFQMSPYGKPNGVTYITFASPEDVHRAVHEKHHKHHMGNRYVEMFIAN